MANSLRYWIPLSMVAHFPGLHTASSLKGCLHMAIQESPPQALSCVPFPITLSMQPSLQTDHSCLSFLPSNSKLLALLSQHQRSQVILCSHRQLLKSFCVSCSSHRDSDQVVASCFASFSCSCDGPALSFFTKQLS